jgi:hypothetical protein
VLFLRRQGLQHGEYQTHIGIQTCTVGKFAPPAQAYQDHPSIRGTVTTLHQALLDEAINDTGHGAKSHITGLCQPTHHHFSVVSKAAQHIPFDRREISAQV